MLVKCSSYPEGIEKDTKLCDYCLQPQPHIYNTKRLKITKRFQSDICEDCFIWWMQAYKKSKEMKEKEEEEVR